MRPFALVSGRSHKCGERCVILLLGAAQINSLAHPVLDDAPLSPPHKLTRLQVKYNIQGPSAADRPDIGRMIRGQDTNRLEMLVRSEANC